LEVLFHDHDDIGGNRKTISEILYKFYHEDIIEENSFIHWYQKPSKRFTGNKTSKKFRQMSEEFIQWLNQPDLSDDQDDDDTKSKVIPLLCIFYLKSSMLYA
jgi:hypothetical protein